MSHLFTRLTFSPKPITLAVCIAFASSLPAVEAFAQQTMTQHQQRDYDLPAGPLAASLNHISREAGLTLTVDAATVGSRRAAAVRGRMSSEQALRQALVGSGLELVKTDLGSYTLRLAAPAPANEAALPDVMVTAAAERDNAWGIVKGYAAKRSATGTKTDTPIIETPQSISVIAAEQIADQKALSVSEALAYTPGVIADPGYANSFDVFYSRGFRIQDGNGGVYRDGLKLGGSGWATGQQEPYGLERVELLKGAASVLFGAAAPGGVLNVVTKQPQPDHVNEVLSEVGNYRHRALAADLGGAWSDNVASRVVLLVRDTDTAVDHIPNNTRFIAPSLSWTPGRDTTLTLLAHYSERRTGYIWGVPVEGSLLPSPYGQLPRQRFVGEPGFDRQDTRQASLGWRLTHQLADGVKLQHGVRWIDSENHVRFTNLNARGTTDPRAYRRRAIDELETTRGMSADTNLQAELDLAGMRHKLIAGFDMANHRIGSVWDIASLASLNLFNPVYGANPGVFAPLFTDRDKQRRAGLYLQDQIKLGALTALAGIRRDDVRSELNGETEETDATTGRLGVVWEVAPGIAPFTSWSQSFEPVSGTGNDGKRYQPTRGAQFELGVRWQAGDFSTSVAAFDLVQKNVLKNRGDLDKAVQTGEVRSRGLEIEAKGAITRNLQLIASYAYTDAKVTRSENAMEIGQSVSNQPRHQAALWARVDNWLTPGVQLGMGARYTGKTSDWGGTGASVPDAITLDALLGYTTGTWTLRLNINNLTDKNTLLCNGRWCTYGDGRRATASVAYRW